MIQKGNDIGTLHPWTQTRSLTINYYKNLASNYPVQNLVPWILQQFV